MSKSLRAQQAAVDEPPETPVLYLVDASIYIYHAWQYQPASRDSEGQPCHAVQGFAHFVETLIERTEATALVFAFDQRGPESIRQQRYPAYKANRAPIPEALAPQFQHCRQWLSALGWPHYADPQIEADDIIGVLAKRAQQRGQPVTIVSADKDLTQFVGKQDHWWDFHRKQRLGYRGVEKRFGVKPEQIADLLALAGDPVDNIPGVPGVGLATAARLLIKWGSLDNLWQNIDAVGQMRFRGAPQIARLLKAHQAAVCQARSLTGLIDTGKVPELCGHNQGQQPEALDWLCGRFNLQSPQAPRD